jgi:transposase-like protein
MDTRGRAEPDWTKRYRLVAGVYAMRDGYILMLERARGMMIGFWSVPGGHVESGETPQEAAARELSEGRCFRAVDMLPSHRRRDIPSGVRGAMITQVLHCPYCDETDIVRHGMSPEGKQRYRCRQCLEGRGRTFLLEYAYAGQSPAVKQQIVDMAMNASGIRDTARVLHVSPTTVIKELKKRNLHSSK